MQRVILREAWDAEPLFAVLTVWTASTADAVYWNRKGKYVAQLAQETEKLLRLGLVCVLPEGSDVPLSLDNAIEVVRTPGNWWRYEPDPEDYGDEIGSPEIVTKIQFSPHYGEHLLDVTPVGRALTPAAAWTEANPSDI